MAITNLRLEFLIFFRPPGDAMGVKISKRYFSCKLKPNVFKFVLNFPLNGPHKTVLLCNCVNKRIIKLIP